MTELQSALAEILPSIAERERADPEAFPAGSLAALYDAGVIAAPFPRELGGRGASLVETVDAIEAIAAASGSVALLASMPMARPPSAALAGRSLREVADDGRAAARHLVRRHPAVVRDPRRRGDRPA